MSHYREAETEGLPREIEASSLRPRTRERLAAAVEGGSSLLSLRPPVLLPRWSVALLLALGLTLSLLALLPHFGSIDPPTIAVERRKMMLAGGLVALAAGAMLGADRARLRRGLPFDPGLYLLPLDLVDARSSRLVVRSLLGLREVTDNRDAHGQGQVSVVHLHFEDGSRFSFPTSATNATRLTADLGALRSSAEQSTSQGQTDRRNALDPFAEERGSWPAHPASPGAERARSPSWPLPIAPLVLPVAFALLAPGLIEARDRASERRCLAVAQRDQDDETLRRIAALSGPLAEQADAARFALAQARGTTEALVHYMREGGLHPGVVDDKLYADSLAAGTLEAFEQYLVTGRAHRDEIFARLFERGEQTGDLAALRVYERQHGPHQDEVIQHLIPRLELQTTPAQALPVAAVRTYITFSRYQDVQALARQRFDEQFDLALARLGPFFPGAPLDVRELIRLARSRNGTLRISFATLDDSLVPNPYRPLKPERVPYSIKDEQVVLIALRALQKDLDLLLGSGLIQLEKVEPDAAERPDIQVAARLVPGEEPHPRSNDLLVPLQFQVALGGALLPRSTLYQTPLLCHRMTRFWEPDDLPHHRDLSLFGVVGPPQRIVTWTLPPPPPPPPPRPPSKPGQRH